jgi:hypothetical protein
MRRGFMKVEHIGWFNRSDVNVSKKILFSLILMLMTFLLMRNCRFSIHLPSNSARNTPSARENAYL